MGEFLNPQEVVDAVRTKVVSVEDVSLADVYKVGLAIRQIVVINYPDLLDGQDPLFRLPKVLDEADSGSRKDGSLTLGYYRDNEGKDSEEEVLSLYWNADGRRSGHETWEVVRSGFAKGSEKFIARWSGPHGGAFYGSDLLVRTFHGIDEAAPIPVNLSGESRRELVQVILDGYDNAARESFPSLS